MNMLMQNLLRIHDPFLHPLIVEMDAANMKAETVKRQTRQDIDVDAAVAKVVQKYLPVGMPLVEAEKVMLDLHKRGFKVYERHYDGGRPWPDGTFGVYTDKVTKRNVQTWMKKGEISYTIYKNYDWRLLLAKRALISIKTDGQVITETKGFIYLDGI